MSPSLLDRESVKLAATMADENSSNDSFSLSAEPISGPAWRRRMADRLPFVLRAWWLRDLREYSEIEWHPDAGFTGPEWSLFSDPLCDVGNLDHGM